VLVTGGAGFIGSHLVELLINNGHHVTVVDNLATGRMENLEDFNHQSRLDFHNADITDFQKIEPLFSGIDWVFHLAALADIVPSVTRPMVYHQANVDGTVAVLEAARSAGVKRFMYSASASCYGIPDEYPTPESAEIRPMYPYALTKNIGEQFVLHWAKVYDMACVSLRLFNVYGPKSRTTGSYGAVFGVFLAQKLAGKPYTVVGDGTQSRDFVFVSDVARAFLLAAQSDVRGQILNVGAGKPNSINSLVSLLGGPVQNIPKRPGEPDVTFADTAKITKALDWHPTIDFEEGVAIMLSHSDMWKNAPVWDESSIAEATKEWFDHLGAGEPSVS